MQTCHIHIQGQVQGVGFRPMVYQAALARGLKGWVLNGVDGVHIQLNGTLAEAESFAAFLYAHAPRLARITQMAVTQVEDHLFSCFEIVHSNTSASPSLLVSPDFALCPECRQELADPANRRAGYPFITCTHCGPRYSILNALPYDRERTTMAPFVQCPVCRAEYDDPIDRRYFSQTNSCPQCGIQLSWLDISGSGEGPSSLDRAIVALEAGQLLAVKGIGGFLLMGDARSPSVVRLLRQRKNRPSKPFAVMYPTMEQLEREVHLSLPAKALLEGPISPVVLAPVRDPHSCSCALEDIIPGLQHLGVLIPYAPLLEAIARRFPFPLLATSGNISQSPIIFGEQKAAEELLGIADFLLGHNRAIRTPQDDSVLRFSPLSHQPIWLRRARGLAPTLLLEAAKRWQTPALAMGADMKSAFSLLHAGNTYVSQYLGALDHWDTQQQFGEVLHYLMELLQAKPAVVLVDGHPGYFSTSSGHTLAADLGVPCMRYPHHLAHFAAILAEHDLFSQPDPILGVILDGTGLGTDGQIWGGEFFQLADHRIERISHLSYFPHLAGDKMSRDGRLCALAICRGIPEADGLLRPMFSETEWRVYQQVLERHRLLYTSSAGRLFDGMAALCGLCTHSSYEGEAALYLEAAALRWLTEQGWENVQGYQCTWGEDGISVPGLLTQVLTDIQNQESVEAISARFHAWIVSAVAQVVQQTACTKLAFSGGVLQNAVLTELLKQRFTPDYTCYFHLELSPNDENISVGQLALFEEKIAFAEQG